MICHSKEQEMSLPWKCEDDSVVECEVLIVDADGYERLNSAKGCQLEWAVENFPRIVACVNACRGITTRDLNGGIVREAMDLWVEAETRHQGDTSID
jgi:hypothetical protein